MLADFVEFGSVGEVGGVDLGHMDVNHTAKGCSQITVEVQWINCTLVWITVIHCNT